MHEIIMSFFKFLKSFFQFMKIVFVFCIIMLLFYWVQNLTGSDWKWLGFITPFLKGLLEIANKIYSVSFDIFGAVFEFKYLSALIILTAFFYLMNLLIIVTNLIEDAYNTSYLVCKKAEEALLNKTLKANVEREEKRINKYSVAISTTLKPKFSHKELNINIQEQNKLMNKFIIEKTGVQPAVFESGFLYQFNRFDEIDNVLEVLFKVIHSNAPLDYAICIQAGDDMEQLKKLISLKHYGMISMAADTAYRYKFNETHRYGTTQVGLFQYGERTLEVHEFKEIL